MKDILSYSGLAQARLIRRGEISSAELVEAHLERIVEVNPLLNAVVEVLAEQAREGARAADERRARGTLLGPLDGVPFSIKDSIEVVGTSCSAGTLGLRNAPRSKRDATLVARLRAAGAIPIARTNLPDLLFAFESDNLIYGRTNNPYDPSIGTRFGEDRSPTVAARNEGAITESGSAITGSGGANVGGKGVITWSGGTIVGTESAITGCGGAIVASAGAIPGSEGLIAGSKSAIAGSESAVVGEEHFDHGVFSSGGSSGGEAALIAACGSPFGLGSDAAGSVRLPSHFCGIASIKPTSGRLARTGHVPGAGGWIETLWQIGPMARRVEDLCAMMAILNGPDGLDHTVVPVPLGDPLRVDVGGLRIAWFADNGIATPTQETAELVRCAAKALGATESRPPRIEESYDLEMKLIGPDGGDGLRAYLRSIGSTPTHRLLDGWIDKLEPYRTGVEGFAKYWESLYGFRAAMFEFLQNYDAVLSPVCATPAVKHGRSIDDATFRGFSYTMTYNVTGWPAAVVRCGESPEGLPIDLQIAAHPWREDVSLAVALRLEEVFGGWKRPPGR